MLPQQKTPQAGASLVPNDSDEARRRMPLRDLFFLAAGGIIGSGWMLAPLAVEQGAGKWSLVSWIICGALMVVLAAVMVELSVRAPKTGGLVFLPLQSSGPLLAMVIATGVWLFYAFNPASEATAVVRGIQLLTGQSGLTNSDGLTWPGGWILGMAVIALVASANLLGSKRFLFINAVVTSIKILIPVALLAVLWFAFRHASLPSSVYSDQVQKDVNYDPVETAVTGAGVVYAYLGFQGPLDFAGKVKRAEWPGEAARLRLAVYGTLIGSIVLYVLLQCVFDHFVPVGRAGYVSSLSYPQLVQDAVPHAGWLARIVEFDMVISPAGTAMVFTYVLTREVAALSRAHLTHRGLQVYRNSVIRVRRKWLKKLLGDDRLDVYPLILFIDFVISIAALAVFGGNWTTLSNITGIMSLVVYATPGIVFAALRLAKPDRFTRVKWLPFVGGALSFLLIAEVFFLIGAGNLWQSMAMLAVGFLLLFGLPYVVTQPIFARWSNWYDATDHARRAWQPANRKSTLSACVLLLFFAALLLLALLPDPLSTDPGTTIVKVNVASLAGGTACAAVLALVAFASMLWLSWQHMKERERARRQEPIFPDPMETRYSLIPWKLMRRRGEDNVG